MKEENRHSNLPYEQTFGERLADRVAQIGGSWPFVSAFGIFMLLWCISNTLLQKWAFDPYPFILLNLVLSTLAALQAPIIMMSQNRQASKDRELANLHYQLAQKAKQEAREVLTLH